MDEEMNRLADAYEALHELSESWWELHESTVTVAGCES